MVESSEERSSETIERAKLLAVKAIKKNRTDTMITLLESGFSIDEVVI